MLPLARARACLEGPMVILKIYMHAIVKNVKHFVSEKMSAWGFQAPLCSSRIKQDH